MQLLQFFFVAFSACTHDVFYSFNVREVLLIFDLRLNLPTRFAVSCDSNLVLLPFQFPNFVTFTLRHTSVEVFVSSKNLAGERQIRDIFLSLLSTLPALFLQTLPYILLPTEFSLSISLLLPLEVSENGSVPIFSFQFLLHPSLVFHNDAHMDVFSLKLPAQCLSRFWSLTQLRTHTLTGIA